ncbi:MAG: ATP-binding cassette domain-containing protein [Candidatus Thiodiazotropha sp.]
MGDLSYIRGEQSVIECLCFQATPSEVTAVLGPNGVGKSTLFDVLSGTISDWPEQKDKMNASYMIQEYSNSLLPWASVKENLNIGYSYSDKEYYERIIKLNEYFGDVFNIFLDNGKKPVSYLSGGQKQRLTFLRTCLSDAKVSIFDEPFSSIDITTRYKLSRGLRLWALSNNRVVLVSLHMIEEAMFLADRILVFHDSPLNNYTLYNMPEGDRTDEWLAKREVSEIRANIGSALYIP